MIVGGKHKPVLNRKGRDLDVGDVIAAQAGRPCQLRGNGLMSGAWRHKTYARLIEVALGDGPALVHGNRVLPEYPVAAHQANEGIDHWPAQDNRPVLL